MKPHAIIAIVVLLLSACDAHHRDISSEKSQRPLIGQRCEVTAVLRAHGVTLATGTERKTDYISIWNPGFNGPELTFLLPLQPGTTLVVLAARECSNCLFDRLVEYEVQVLPEPPPFAGRPAYIRADSLDVPYVRCTAQVRSNKSFLPDTQRQCAAMLAGERTPCGALPLRAYQLQR